MPSTSAGCSPRPAASASTNCQIGVVGVWTGGYSLVWMVTFASRARFSPENHLVRAGELQVVLGHEAEDHLAAHGGDPADAGHREQRGHTELLRQAVAAVGLDRLVDGARGRLRRGVLGAVGGTAGVPAAV